MDTIPRHPNNAAQRNMGTEVAVANVATMTDVIPSRRLNATAVPLPVARCAEGSASGV